MAVGPADHAPRRGLGAILDALFGEAWERQRRRRRRYLLATLLACLIAVGAVFALRGRAAQPPPANKATPAVAAATHYVVSSARLRGDYSSLAVVDGRLIVWNGDGMGASQSVPSTSAIPGRLGGQMISNDCAAATVDPVTLRARTDIELSCADPRLYLEHVLPVLEPDRRGSTGLVDQLRISTSSHARAGYTLGPVIASWAECSSCNAVWAYGDGSLWIYAPAVKRDDGTDLFRISERTGRVVRRWSLPGLDRPLLAVDAKGLWIAPSLFSGSGRQWLYRITPGATKPERALALDGFGALWMVATGNTVWIDAAGRRGASAPSTLWRLGGPGVTRTKVAAGVKGANQCLASGDGPAQIAGNSSAGIYCFGVDANGTIFHIDSSSGNGGRIATVKVPGPVYAAPAAMVGNSFLFLVPGTHRIYRVRAR